MDMQEDHYHKINDKLDAITEKIMDQFSEFNARLSVTEDRVSGIKSHIFVFYAGLISGFGYLVKKVFDI